MYLDTWTPGLESRSLPTERTVEVDLALNLDRTKRGPKDSINIRRSQSGSKTQDKGDTRNRVL